jgi:hypothetical protein
MKLILTLSLAAVALAQTAYNRETINEAGASNRASPDPSRLAPNALVPSCPRSRTGPVQGIWHWDSHVALP